MPDSQWENLKEIFHAAVALKADAREAYLDKVCDGDLSLRGAVASLLKSRDETGNFVDEPAYEAAAEMLAHDTKENLSRELKPGQSVAHYKIISVLGEGGMGKVYLAHDTPLDRKVALKILSADVASNQERMRRFTQEARMAAALHHPNVAQIFEVGHDDHQLLYSRGRIIGDLWLMSLGK